MLRPGPTLRCPEELEQPGRSPRRPAERPLQDAGENQNVAFLPQSPFKVAAWPRPSGLVLLRSPPSTGKLVTGHAAAFLVDL